MGGVMNSSIGFSNINKVSSKSRLRNILNAPSTSGYTQEHIIAAPVQGFMKAPQSTVSIRVSDTSPMETMAFSRDNTPRRIQRYINNLNEPEIIKPVTDFTQKNYSHNANDLEEHKQGSPRTLHAHYQSIMPNILLEEGRGAKSTSGRLHENNLHFGRNTLSDQ